jgi:Toastrack DUF4097
MKNYSFKIAFIAITILANISILASVSKFGHDDLKFIKEKSFPTTEGKTLFVKVSGGDVDLSSWDKNEVYVKILGNENAEEKFNFEINSTDNGVEIVSKKKDSGMNWFHNIKLKVEVKVPAKYNSDINTSGGDIVYNGINGTAELNTSGGDIDGKGFSGKLEISTSGGDIKLFGSNTEINANTSGGDISLNYSGTNMGIDLSTSGGDITVNLPEDFKASMELSTSGGDVSCSFSMSNVTKMSHSKLIADLNGGGKKLDASTSGGDIDVSSK